MLPARRARGSPARPAEQLRHRHLLDAAGAARAEDGLRIDGGQHGDSPVQQRPIAERLAADAAGIRRPGHQDLAGHGLDDSALEEPGEPQLLRLPQLPRREAHMWTGKSDVGQPVRPGS